MGIVFVQDIAIVSVSGFVVGQNGAIVGVEVLQTVFLGLFSVSFNYQIDRMHLRESKLGFLSDISTHGGQSMGAMHLPGPPGEPRPWI